MHETTIRQRPGWISIDWQELWESRELLYFLVLRDTKVRYKQTVLGVAWAALQPLLTMVVFTVIFGNFAKMPSDGIPYALFVFAGLLPWMFFANAVSQSAHSLVNQQALLTKIYLPRLFIPISTIVGGLLDLGVAFIIFACIALYYRAAPGWGVLLVPLLVVLTIAAASGVGLTLAALIVTYRDFRYVIPFMVQSWMYISPVIYPVTSVPQDWQWLLALNPMTGIIDAFRSALFGRPWNFLTLTVSSASSIALLAYGMFYFRKTERRFADIA